jgi:HEPN domain-containing protein
VDDNKRNLVEGWLDKASKHLQTAREQVKSYFTASEAIQAAQVCVELSVKSVLTMLEIDFPLSHGWNEKQLRQIAEQIEKRGLLARLKEHVCQIRLPRLLILVNFWQQFYIQAKYGIEDGNLAPARDLFEKPEAELAVAHAEECLMAALAIRATADDKLAAILA